MKKENPLQIFADESPKVQKAYAGFIQSLIDMEGLKAALKFLPIVLQSYDGNKNYE